MKIKTLLPFEFIEPLGDFYRHDVVAGVGPLLESLGYAGCTVTDHPCPSGRWLDAGGHYAQDPFVLLSMIAATTRKLELHTGILVLPYRNPFITARAVATLDALSGGRVFLGIGAGYLKAEYHALGVDFERRNDIMDEYIAAMKAAWTGTDFSFEGSGYSARGCRMRPAPAQKPHPMLIIGGNSRRAMRRAVDIGDAWGPFFTVGALSTTARTVPLENLSDLAACLQYMREYAEKVERPMPKVIASSLTTPGEKLSAEATIERIGKLAEMGVEGASHSLHVSTYAEYCENVAEFSRAVLSKMD